IGLFLTYLYFMFSEAGGVQRKLWDVVLSRLAWEGQGEALDIGTGQGALAIGLATRKLIARVRGVDLWAADWAYSKAACERNAKALGVGDRVSFARASAAALPFDDASMDAVVSHFVFHEVGDGGGPRGALKEAVRVLKPGGAFCVQDMFLDRRVYGDVDALLGELRAWGLEHVRLARLSELTRIPWGMGGRRVLGCAAVIVGVKRDER
ncbi:MAG: class I SAM-dependent methyltransferase, partial [Hyphomonadaceae bacterium]